MIGYVTLGTNDVQKAAAFYDKLLEPLGGKRFMEDDKMVAWMASPQTPGIGVIKPHDGKPATAGNGTMVALAVDSREKVDAIYAKAMELGAADEGAPGPRSETFYAGYFRDPDGNKLNVFYMSSAG